MTDPKRILIVEDEPIVAADLKSRLNSLGYEGVGPFSSGENALSSIEYQPPDLVLMDIRLKGAMDGIDTAQQIRERWHLPVIFLTAYSEDATLSRAKQAKPLAYLLKPFEERELKTAIEIAIYKHQVDEEIRNLNTLLEQRVQARTAELEAANRELEAFGYSVSHDLRAPLRAINGFAHILQEDYRSVLDAEGQRLCNVICDNARRMGQLIDDLLAFSQLSRAQMRWERLDMGALAREAYEEVTSPEERQRITLRLNPLPEASGDGRLIRQVWINLLGNSAKFSRKREQPLIEVTGRQEHDTCLYSVRDNGAGFNMKYADRLFGVFQRLHSEGEFPGTGVGLAIVQRVVHRHGGSIWAEARKGEGATFHFRLPAAQDPTTPALGSNRSRVPSAQKSESDL